MNKDVLLVVKQNM